MKGKKKKGVAVVEKDAVQKEEKGVDFTSQGTRTDVRATPRPWGANDGLCGVGSTDMDTVLSARCEWQNSNLHAAHARPHQSGLRPQASGRTTPDWTDGPVRERSGDEQRHSPDT